MTVAPAQTIIAAAAPVAPAQAAAVTPTLTAPLKIPAAPAAPVLAAAPDSRHSACRGGCATVRCTGHGLRFLLQFVQRRAPAATPAQQPVTTASTTPPAGTSTGTSNWAGSTSLASGAAKTPAAAAPGAAAPTAAAKVPSGKYKLHIAAVRSRAEADALAQKLASQQGAALKSRMPVVDEAVIGSMGTFYRVRVGSFATPDESRGVCNTLRSSGFDCLVVTN